MKDFQKNIDNLVSKILKEEIETKSRKIAEQVNVSSIDPETDQYGLNHEAGHFLYIVKFTAEYFRYRSESEKNKTYEEGGHGETDECGKVATKYGNLKDIPQPSPAILLKGN